MDNEPLREIGAKLSAESRTRVQSAIDTLGAMLLTDPVQGADPKPGDDPSSTSADHGDNAIHIHLHDPNYTEAVLSTKARKDLDSDEFAWPEEKKYPINDKAHADNAAARFAQHSDEIPANIRSKVLARIKAAQRKFGEKPAMKEGRTVIPDKLNIMAESAVVFAEADGNDADHPRYQMLVIKEGMSSNRVNYPGAVLRESAARLNGRPIHVDHPDNARGTGLQERSLTTKAGWWSDSHYVEGMTLPDGSVINGTVAVANLYSKEASPVPWFPAMVQESLDRGVPSAVGISIYAAGKTKITRDEGGPYKEALSIDMYASADAVAEPGAGGMPLALVASEGIDPDVKAIAEMTLEEFKEARPDLFPDPKAVVDPPKPEAKTEPLVEDKKPDPEVTALVESLKSQSAELAASMKMQQILATSALVESKLAPSRLPKTVKDLIREETKDQIMVESDIIKLLEKFESVARSVVGDDDSPTRLSQSHVIPFGGGGVMAEGTSPLDQVMLSLDDFFGAPVPDDKKGKFPKIHSFREAYSQITGDYTMSGAYDQRASVLGDMWFREGNLPGAAHVVGGATITMSNLLGVSMNKALVNFYMVQPKWWEPIVNKVDLQNMKAQIRIRLSSFASLTERTVDGAEYTELDWAEVAETYTPTEFGNVVTIGRRAIINDDLRGIQRIPQQMAKAAITTINEKIAANFTANSGNGPTLADSVQVFNSASHQGNRINPAAFSRANVIAMRNVLRKMTDDAGKRIGATPRWLIVPADLEVDAWELVNTELVPESNNNARNILANSTSGLKGVIVPPQFIDTDNYYLMVDNSEIESIELGFLYGRETPEMFTQDNPATGFVFSNDVMTQKVRWDFGTAWVDYRGACAAINP